MKKLSKEQIEQLNKIFREENLDGDSNCYCINKDFNFDNPFISTGENTGYYVANSETWETFWKQFKDFLIEDLNIKSLEELKKMKPNEVIKKIANKWDDGDFENEWKSMDQLENEIKEIGEINLTEEGQEKVKAILAGESIKDSKKVQDEEQDDVTKVCKLLGEAHDKIMEALDLVEELENEEILSSNARYDLEDLEASASAFDFTGEDDPRAAFMEKYEESSDGDEYPDDDDMYD